MKKTTRIIAFIMMVMLLVTSLPLTSFAATINCGSNGSASERTFAIYHSWGKAVKMSRHDEGIVKNVLGNEEEAYGTYKYVVKDPNGKQIKSGTWKADTTSSVTLIKATASAGTYSITVSKVSINTVKYPGFTSWALYPRYKFTY